MFGFSQCIGLCGSVMSKNRQKKAFILNKGLSILRIPCANVYPYVRPRVLCADRCHPFVSVREVLNP